MHFKLKSVFTFGAGSTLLLIMYLFLKQETSITLEDIDCYRSDAPTLPDISNEPSIDNKAIFFIESSCSSFYRNKIHINARQACSVESAARMNPNRTIHLLYASPGEFNFRDNTESDRFLETLISYPNVKINHINYANALKNSPVENLYNSGSLESSNYAVAHASDVLRLLLLWKYGGIYLDLDVVVLKSLETLASNFAGYQSEETIANGVLGFNASGAGHEIALKCLLHLQRHFNGKEWSENGPLVITTILQEVCGANNERNSSLCASFQVYAPDAFYPIPWPHWQQYFEEDTDENMEKLFGKSYGAHVWNHLSGNKKVRLDSNVVYAKIARKFCPRIYQQCDLYF